MIVRQDIVTWYRPEEKLPPAFTYVVVTFSGHKGRLTYDHTLAVADWMYDEEGWRLMELDDLDDYTVHAWCDLEPYKGD